MRVNDADWKFGDDVFANPLPLWTAWAAMVHHLEGLRPVATDALSFIDVAGVRVTRCRFTGARDVEVWWADRDVPIAAISDWPANAQASDLFANPVAAPERLGSRPVYVTRRR
jgi:hypothetical protein